MTQPEVALTLSAGQLWAALVLIGGAFLALIVYIYLQEIARINARLDGLHKKINEEVEELRTDFNDKLTAQNHQLAQTVSQIHAVTEKMQQVLTDFDKRLLRHEVRMGG